MTLYFDASVLVPLFVVEQHSQVVMQWLERVTGRLMISDLAAAEVGSTMSRLVRSKQITEVDKSGVLIEFDRWREFVADRIENLPTDIVDAGQLVRTPFPKLLTPDAIHIATCRRANLTLVTHDERMIDVAQREAVPVVKPE